MSTACNPRQLFYYIFQQRRLIPGSWWPEQQVLYEKTRTRIILRHPYTHKRVKIALLAPASYIFLSRRQTSTPGIILELVCPIPTECMRNWQRWRASNTKAPSMQCCKGHLQMIRASWKCSPNRQDPFRQWLICNLYWSNDKRFSIVWGIAEVEEAVILTSPMSLIDQDDREAPDIHWVAIEAH